MWYFKIHTDPKCCHVVFNGSVCILEERLLELFLGNSLLVGCINACMCAGKSGVCKRSKFIVVDVNT